jgi:hypothetical protein
VIHRSTGAEDAGPSPQTGQFESQAIVTESPMCHTSFALGVVKSASAGRADRREIDMSGSLIALWLSSSGCNLKDAKLKEG